MNLGKIIGEAVSTAIRKVADFVRPDPEPRPAMPRDSLQVSPSALAAARQPEVLPVLPSCGPTPAAPALPGMPANAGTSSVAGTPGAVDGLVYQTGTDQTYGDLVYRGQDDGVADGNMVVYRPGRESGRVGPMQVADSSTPGRGKVQPSTGVWA